MWKKNYEKPLKGICNHILKGLQKIKLSEKLREVLRELFPTINYIKAYFT